MQSRNLHILCWTLMYLYILVAYLFSLSDIVSVMLGISLTVAQMIQFYFCYSLVFPLYLRRKKWWILLVGFILAMILFISLRYALEEVLYLKLFQLNNYGANVSAKAYIVDNLYYGSAFLCISALVFSVEQNYKMHLKHAALLEERKQTELAFLRTQVNPHFLFNTLNFLYSQALPVSEKLSDAILKLAELMRYTLAGHPNDGVEVQKEVNYLENFIALHRMRFGDALFVQFKVDLQQPHLLIAPLILLPFVENAFKHGITTKAEKPIQINIIENESVLKMQVLNQVSSGPKDDSHGIGLDNVRRRLDLLYTNRHSLKVVDTGHTYQVDLEIHLKRNKDHEI